jgi:hypothetical protein
MGLDSPMAVYSSQLVQDDALIVNADWAELHMAVNRCSSDRAGTIRTVHGWQRNKANWGAYSERLTASPVLQGPGPLQSCATLCAYVIMAPINVRVRRQSDAPLDRETTFRA